MAEASNCVRCGKEIDTSFAFCPHCGSGRETAAEPPKAETAISRKSAEALDAFERQFAELKEKRAAAGGRKTMAAPNNWFYIVLALFTTLVLIGLFLFFKSAMSQMMMHNKY